MKNVLCLVIFITALFSQNIKRTVPEWAKSAIWYQIFPERFNNGDKSNDPKAKDIEGGWPHFIPEGWQVKEWTSDWYKQEGWELKTNFKFYQNAGLRRYGGDLQGVIDKLDYLQDLGITAIYFNPLFEAPSLHKYDATMYHHIDNNFGPDPEGDRKIWESENPEDPSTWKWTSADKLFLKLIEECHKREMKVIIDGVFNHTGNTFWAFQDVIKNQAKSKYKDWYYIDKFDDLATSENEFKYNGWYGVQDLPEIRETEDGLIDAAAKHIKAIVERWGDPNGDGNPADGIDGWRLDVADMVNINFWKKFRGWVKDINPNAYLTGEIWWEDWNNYKMFVGTKWLQGDAFDAIMNYRFARAIKNFVADQKDKFSANEFADSLKQQYKDYSHDQLLIMMNLLDSHDVERFSSIIINPDVWYDHRQNPEQNIKFDIRKPTDEDYKKLKLAWALQMTLPGAPMIYYGAEAGMWGGDDPDCRKPMVWEEYHYETETTHPFHKVDRNDEVKFNKDLFDWYKKMITIRKNNKSLILGKVDFIDYPKDKNILIFERSYNNEILQILVNNQNEEKEIELNKKGLTNIIDKKKLDSNKVKLEKYSMIILK